MRAADDKEVQSALRKLLHPISPVATCHVLIREALVELSDDELGILRPEQLATWKGLTAQGRRLEWSEARRCEAALEKLLGSSSAVPIMKSISHTSGHQGEDKNHSIVFAAGVVGKISGVGIDAEGVSRDISEAISERFMNPADRSFGLTPLQVWVVKEALFKANPANSGTSLIQYYLRSYDRVAKQGSAEIGDRKLQFALIDLPTWVVAVAVAPANQS